MDIIFQFGKFFNSSSSGDDWFWKILPPIITAGTAYFIFWLGQKKTTDKEKIKEEKRIKEVREYFYVCLLKLKLGVEAQIKGFDTIIKALENDRINYTSIYRNSDISYELLPDQLLSISKADTFKFLIQNKETDKHLRIKLYSGFYSHLEIIKKIMFQIEDHHEKSLPEYSKLQLEIEENKSSIVELLINETHKNKEILNGMINDPYYVAISNYYSTYMLNQDGTLDPIMKYFIIPCKEVTFEKFINHSDSKTVLKYCQNAEYAYGKIFENKRVSIKTIEHWNEMVIGLQKVIDSIFKIEFADFDYNVEIFKKTSN